MRAWTGGKITLLGNLPPRDVLAAGTPADVERGGDRDAERRRRPLAAHPVLRRRHAAGGDERRTSRRSSRPSTRSPARGPPATRPDTTTLKQMQVMDLPPALREHLFERLRERPINAEDLYELKLWRESEPEAPEGA